MNRKIFLIFVLFLLQIIYSMDSKKISFLKNTFLKKNTELSIKPRSNLDSEANDLTEMQKQFLNQERNKNEKNTDYIMFNTIY